MNDSEDPITKAVLAVSARSMVVVRAVYRALGLPLVSRADGRRVYLDPESLQPVQWPGMPVPEPPRDPSKIR